MTPQEAEDLAARTLVAITETARHAVSRYEQNSATADRERVASDLRLLRLTWAWMTTGPNVAAWDAVNEEARNSLRRTAALYGVSDV